MTDLQKYAYQQLQTAKQDLKSAKNCMKRSKDWKQKKVCVIFSGKKIMKFKNELETIEKMIFLLTTMISFYY